MLAVADLVDRDAAAEQVVGVGLIGLQANREDKAQFEEVQAIMNSRKNAGRKADYM